LEDLGKDGRIMLTWLLRKWDGKRWGEVDSSGL
jgi:hypothetical protein